MLFLETNTTAAVQSITNLPVIGWIVILIAVVLLFVLAWFKGVSVDKIGLKTGIDKKLKDYDYKKSCDEALRIELYHKTLEMDQQEHADIRKLAKGIQRQIRVLLGIKTSCDIAFHSLSVSLSDIFLQRAIENNLRNKLIPSNRKFYYRDMELEIQDVYNEYRKMIQAANCGRNYPEYEEIEELIEAIIEKWSKDARQIIVQNCQEKIRLYEKFQEQFYSEIYKANSITYPIEKNQKYINDLSSEEEK